MNKIILYKIDGRKKIRSWSIEKTEKGLEIEHGIYNGEKTFTLEKIEYGLAGRTLKQQIDLVYDSKLKKKIDAGYKITIEDARNSIGKNSLGLIKPMLATKLKENSIFKETFVQKKYNGHRCLITNNGGELRAYSRRGILIKTIDHILEELEMPENTTLDGELYKHGWSLQKIGSKVKKLQDDTNQIKFICYDVVNKDSYKKRLEFIENLLILKKNSLVAETDFLFGNFNPIEIMKYYIKRGYEGAILRINDCPYQPDKRSSNLIKVKQNLDAEYKILKISESKDGHAIFHLEHDGSPFKVLCHGPHSYKKQMYQNRIEIINSEKHVTIEYPEYTEAGIPFQPVCIGFYDPI